MAPRALTIGLMRAVAVSVALLAALILPLATPARAQLGPEGILAPGNAIVTGFSGAPAPAQLPLGIDPRDLTFIDLNGPSARIIDLQALGGPPNGQMVRAQKPFTFTAREVGQVFGVTLDNNVPPNIYLAPTAAYGIPLVAPGLDGTPRHVATGGPNVDYMPGLWGPREKRGGPGAIWKIDGSTGAVSLFAYVTLDGTPTSAVALGGIAYHAESNSIFAAARDTGLIQRFTQSAQRGRYDHGVRGRGALGLPPVPYDPAARVDIKSSQFDSQDPTTWGFAPPERRIFGLAIHDSRLYYAVAAGPQIWSIALRPDGPFGDDPTLEINLPPGLGPTEISKIAFDDQGRMILAERPDPTGAYDFTALTRENTGRVLRYARVDSTPGAPRVWQPVPDEYAIGFPPDHHNANGGAAIGFGYDRRGVIDRGACGDFLWTTGEQLRASPDRAAAERYRRGGPLNVDGLQGNALWRVRPQNVPPLKSYFIDYDDRFGNPATRGHLGDIAIWRVCGPLLRGGWMLPEWIETFISRPGSGGRVPPPPQLSCPPDQQKSGFQCCPSGSAPDASGACKAWCPNGALDPNSRKLCALGFDAASFDPNDPAKLACIGGAKPAAGKGILGCVLSSPVLNAPVCQAGWSKQNVPNLGSLCMPSPAQAKCAPGEQIGSDGKCHALCSGGSAWPSRQCCAAGAQVSLTGQCCPAGSNPDPKTGSCCTGGLVFDAKAGRCGPPRRIPPPPPPSTCASGQESSDGTCCRTGWTPNKLGGGCCQPGQKADAAGVCKWTLCIPPAKQVGGRCCQPDDFKPGGACTTTTCIPVGPNNTCCHPSKVYIGRNGEQACCTGEVREGRCQSDNSGGGGSNNQGGGGTPGQSQCTPGTSDPNCCASGYKPVGGSCCRVSQITSGGTCCPSGQAPGGPNRSQCRPIIINWQPPPGGGPGGLQTGNQCCAPGLIPTASGSCCRRDQVNSAGVCCQSGTKPNIRGFATCEPAQPQQPQQPPSCGVRETMVNGTCCPNARLYRDASGGQQCCAQEVDPRHKGCPSYQGQPLQPLQPLQPTCVAGFTRMPDGTCCANNRVSRDKKSCTTPSRPPQFIPQFVPAPEQPPPPSRWRPGRFKPGPPPRWRSPPQRVRSPTQIMRPRTPAQTRRPQLRAPLVRTPQFRAPAIRGGRFR